MPSPPELTSTVLGWDKFQHASAYAVLTFLAIRACPTARPSIMLIFIAVVLFGVAIEIAQGLFTHNRYPDIIDSFANLCGSLLIAICFYIYRKFSADSRLKPPFRVAILFIIPLLYVPEAVCAEHVFNSMSEVKASVSRLGDEAGEFLSTPFGIEKNAIFITLAVAGVVAITSVYDKNISEEVSSHKSRGLDRASNSASIIGDPFVHLGFAAAVYGGGILSDSPRYRDLGEMFGEAVILADATAMILKQSIGRGRPSVTDGPGHYKPLQFRGDYDSLPSMHTASSFAMASVMASSSENFLTGFASYAAATFVGLSRIYQEKHWASDVLLGAAIGELAGTVVTRYHARIGKQNIAIMPILSDSSAMVALTGRY